MLNVKFCLASKVFQFHEYTTTPGNAATSWNMH